MTYIHEWLQYAHEQTPQYVWDFSALLGPLLLAAIGSVLYYLYRQWKYSQRDFMDQITFSFDDFSETDEGRSLLNLWTFGNYFARNVFIGSHDVLLQKVQAAAQKTTTDDVFVRLPEEDMRHMNKAVLNTIASASQPGLLARMNGQETEQVRVLMAVTCEPDETVEQRKIRVIMATERDLERLLDDEFCKQVTYHSDRHADRLRTLRAMAEEYQKQGWDGRRTNVVNAMRLLRPAA